MSVPVVLNKPYVLLQEAQSVQVIQPDADNIKFGTITQQYDGSDFEIEEWPVMFDMRDCKARFIYNDQQYFVLDENKIIAREEAPL